MYPTLDEARSVLRAVQAGLRDRVDSGKPVPRVIVCPPSVALVPLPGDGGRPSRAARRPELALGAGGPFTGEVSAAMLEGLVEYVMVGHSERRAMGETDEQVARKVAAVAGSRLVPILFVGEDDRGDDPPALTEQRLRHGLSRVDVGSQEVLVVHEPAWAVGTDQAASPDHVGRTVEHVKAVLTELGLPEPEVIYGGAVAPDNLDEFASIDVLDGVGATRAGLDPETFLRMVDRFASR